ncbi:MAG: pyridoxamine 5'-phosphate oxidase family protein [Desulfobacter sp.]|nr:MAG: pyridoxamine 5'-phosphate oxidase family protein [Desulfobacter sp.]
MQNEPIEPAMAGIREDCLRLIQETRVMTLSTRAATCRTGEETEDASGSGVWAAPVYFIFRQGGFYFFSSPASRHIHEGVGYPAAASLFQDAEDPARLRGLQMSGGIRPCTAGKEAGAAALAYVGRFGIPAGPGNLLRFFKTQFHSDLYKFIPETAYFMDNQRGIGNRAKILL